MNFHALLFCPDEKTARITTQVLSELEFGVEICTEPFAAVKKLMGQHFDAIVVDCDNEQNASLLFKSARNSGSNQASLAVAVVEGQAGVANAFRIGANLVLTKPINVEQAKSTLRVARGLLRKGSDTKPAAPAATTTAPMQPAARTTANSQDFGRLPVPPTQTKPTPAAFQSSNPVQPVAFTQSSSEGAGLLDMVDEDAGSAAVPAEEILLDEMDDHSAPPALQTPSSLSHGLRRPDAASGFPKPSANAPIADSHTVTQPLQRSVRTMPGLPARSASGSATAPAPARQASQPAPARRPITPAAVPPASAPAFTGLRAADLDEGTQDKGRKIRLIAGLAAAILIISSYFGWTRIHGKHAAQTAAQTPAVPPATTNPQSSDGTAQAAAVETKPSAGVQGGQQPMDPLLANRAAANSKPADDESEVTVTHNPGSAPKAPIVVKSDLGTAAVERQQQTASVEAPAPPMATGSGDQSAISNIIQSTSVSVPKAADPFSILKISQGVTQGMLIKRVQPIYPPQARQLRLQGAVQLQAMISKEGSITSIKVVNGEPALARSAVDAVKQWKYKPYYLNGEPVEIQTQVTVIFKLP